MDGVLKKPFYQTACMCAKSLQSCLTLCDPMNCALGAPLSTRILQQRVLEWVAISFSRGSSQPRGSHLMCDLMPLTQAGRFFTTSATWGAQVESYEIVNTWPFLNYRNCNFMQFYLKMSRKHLNSNITNISFLHRSTPNHVLLCTWTHYWSDAETTIKFRNLQLTWNRSTSY